MSIEVKICPQLKNAIDNATGVIANKGKLCHRLCEHPGCPVSVTARKVAENNRSFFIDTEVDGLLNCPSKDTTNNVSIEAETLIFSSEEVTQK